MIKFYTLTKRLDGSSTSCVSRRCCEWTWCLGGWVQCTTMQLTDGKIALKKGKEKE